MNCSLSCEAQLRCPPPVGITLSLSLYLGHAWIGFPPAGLHLEGRDVFYLYLAKHRCPVYVCGIQCLIKSCPLASSFHFIRAWSDLLGSSSISQSKELTRIPWRFNGVAAWPYIVRATWEEDFFFRGRYWSSSLRNK